MRRWLTFWGRPAVWTDVWVFDPHQQREDRRAVGQHQRRADRVHLQRA